MLHKTFGLSGLYGANVSSRTKGHPFDPLDARALPSPPLSFAPFGSVDEAAAIKTYVDWGFSTVRLLVVLESIFPDGPEQMNVAYLDQVCAFVSRLRDEYASRGKPLFVLLDFHEDLFCRRLGGCGQPAWLLPEKYRQETTAPGGKTPMTLSGGGSNSADSADSADSSASAPACISLVSKTTGNSWGKRFITDPRQKKVWTSFLTNEDEINDKYISCITRALEYIISTKKTLLDGIDIINEPALPDLGGLAMFAEQAFQRHKLDEAVGRLNTFYAKAIYSIESMLAAHSGEGADNPRHFSPAYVLGSYGFDGTYMLGVRVGMRGLCPAVRRLFAARAKEGNAVSTSTASATAADGVVESDGNGAAPLSPPSPDRLVFGAHMYQPLANAGPSAKSILIKHIKTTLTGGFGSCWMGEFGDISYGRDTRQTLMQAQAAEMKRIAMGWAVWEYCPTYMGTLETQLKKGAKESGSAPSRFSVTLENYQEFYPWNGEYCSIVNRDLTPAPVYHLALDSAIHDWVHCETKLGVSDPMVLQSLQSAGLANKQVSLQKPLSSGVLLRVKSYYEFCRLQLWVLQTEYYISILDADQGLVLVFSTVQTKKEAKTAELVFSAVSNWIRETKKPETQGAEVELNPNGEAFDIDIVCSVRGGDGQDSGTIVLGQ